MNIMLRDIKLDFSQIATVVGGLILLVIGVYLTYLITTTNSGRINPLMFAPTAFIGNLKGGVVMSNLKGVVMVGGLGTRFKPLTNYLQKCMIPIGRNEKPILEYIVRLYKHHDIEEMVLLAGYKHQQIRNYFNDGERFGVNISYVLDRPDLKGSANALLNAYWEGAQPASK